MKSTSTKTRKQLILEALAATFNTTLSRKQLAKLLNTAPSSITADVQRLIKDGLVAEGQKAPDEQTKQLATKLKITPAGLKSIGRPPQKPCLKYKACNLQPGVAFEGVYSGISRTPTFAGRHEDWLCIETPTQNLWIESVASVAYNRQFIHPGQTIKVVYEGWLNKKKCHSFAFMIHENNRWYLACNKKLIIGEWDVKRKGNRNEF